MLDRLLSLDIIVSEKVQVVQLCDGILQNDMQYSRIHASLFTLSISCLITTDIIHEIELQNSLDQTFVLWQKTAEVGG